MATGQIDDKGTGTAALIRQQWCVDGGVGTLAAPVVELSTRKVGLTEELRTSKARPSAIPMTTATSAVSYTPRRNWLAKTMQAIGQKMAEGQQAMQQLYGEAEQAVVAEVDMRALPE